MGPRSIFDLLKALTGCEKGDAWSSGIQGGGSLALKVLFNERRIMQESPEVR